LPLYNIRVLIKVMYIIMVNLRRKSNSWQSPLIFSKTLRLHNYIWGWVEVFGWFSILFEIVIFGTWILLFKYFKNKQKQKVNTIILLYKALVLSLNLYILLNFKDFFELYFWDVDADMEDDELCQSDWKSQKEEIKWCYITWKWVEVRVA